MSEYHSPARHPGDVGPCLCGRSDRRHMCGWEWFGIDAIAGMVLSTLGLTILVLAALGVWALWH